MDVDLGEMYVFECVLGCCSFEYKQQSFGVGPHIIVKGNSHVLVRRDLKKTVKRERCKKVGRCTHNFLELLQVGDFGYLVCLVGDVLL